MRETIPQLSSNFCSISALSTLQRCSCSRLCAPWQSAPQYPIVLHVAHLSITVAEEAATPQAAHVVGGAMTSNSDMVEKLTRRTLAGAPWPGDLTERRRGSPGLLHQWPGYLDTWRTGALD